MSDYTPIDCSLYDRYEAWATKRTTIRIHHRTGPAEEQLNIGRIVDLFIEDKAEWLRFTDGTCIRLDRIVRAEEDDMRT